MGKKPAERAVTMAAAHASGFDASVLCGTCGAPSRWSQKRFRRCANGHVFVKKSDQ